jgi:hypothetical protein
VIGQYLRDDVWATCGVQFRLVNLIPIPVSKAYLVPKGHSTLSGTLADFWELISKHPQYKEGAVTVLFAPWCSDYDAAAPGEILPPAGQSLIGRHFACVRPAAGSNVLAHELGHVIMQTSDHPSCTKPPSSPQAQNVMCPYAGPGVAADQYAECKAARAHLASSGLLRWFPGQK